MRDATAAFTFRPLEHRDISMIHGWFHAPHARRWYGERGTLDEVREAYGAAIERRSPVAAWVARLDARDVGLVSWERFGDSPEMQRAYAIDDADRANCDVLLGEPDMAHRGLGASMITAFLGEIVFADPRITGCVIDPEVDNTIAIRAYEKVGFRFVRALADDGEGHAVYLMDLAREDLGRTAPAAFFIRPGRLAELDLARGIDDDACTLYAEAGVPIDTTSDDPFFAREIREWTEALDAGRLLFACAPSGEPVGFASLGFVEGAPHLEQLSVRRAWMQRGLGRALVERAIRWSVGAGELWLTTYDHLPWNRPFYERMGFERVDELRCGPRMRAILADERRVIPAPEHRVAMCYCHAR
jgi:RimJ/RimL family protein N-acetyltransferase